MTCQESARLLYEVGMSRLTVAERTACVGHVRGCPPCWETLQVRAKRAAEGSTAEEQARVDATARRLKAKDLADPEAVL